MAMDRDLESSLRRLQETQKQISQGAYSASGVVNGALDDGSESGRLYSSGARTFSSLSIALMGLGFITYASIKEDGIKRAKLYAESFKTYGGPGYTTIPLIDGSNIQIAGFNRASASENLNSLARINGDRLEVLTFTNTEADKRMELERRLVDYNVCYADRTKGTLTLSFNNAEEAEKALSYIKANIKLKEHNVKSYNLNAKGNRLVINEIEGSDASCIVQQLARNYAKEKYKFVKLLKDNEVISLADAQQALREPLKPLSEDMKSRIKAYISSEHSYLDNVIARDIQAGYAKYEEFEWMTNLPVEVRGINGNNSNSLINPDGSFNDGDFWLNIRQVKGVEEFEKDPSGFANVLNGKEMPVAFQFLGEDTSKFRSAMGVAGVTHDGDGKMVGNVSMDQFGQWLSLNRDKTIEFSLHDENSGGGMSLEEFKTMMKEELPSIPWCQPFSDTGTVLVPSRHVGTILAAQRVFLEKHNQPQLAMQVGKNAAAVDFQNSHPTAQSIMNGAGAVLDMGAREAFGDDYEQSEDRGFR